MFLKYQQTLESIKKNADSCSRRSLSLGIYLFIFYPFMGEISDKYLVLFVFKSS
ncbi:hypothetical protein VIAQ111709_17705 [Vibrio aquimaris]|uniref:Uncharacterized protein n=1 Tax=Vibrio aquimaris TaxID=2587862 RepID=A0A5P9CKH5_9VIBR|nr:hypothetical protein FIV01_09925 [Vibrio aquimaris]